jgi:hypothetical protein
MQTTKGHKTMTASTLTPEQLNSLADERQSYGDIREALELRQKAAKLKRQINAEKLELARSAQ